MLLAAFEGERGEWRGEARSANNSPFAYTPMLELIKRNEPIQASAEITVSVSLGRQEAGLWHGAPRQAGGGGKEDWVSLALGLVFFLLFQLPLLARPPPVHLFVYSH